MVTDLAASNWTDIDWETALPWIQEYMATLGYNVRYEGVDSKGKTYIGKEFKAGLSNRHLHVDMLPGYENMAPLGVESTVAENKARADQQSIEITEIAKKFEPEVYERAKNFYKSGDNARDEINIRKAVENQMNSMGYYFNDETQQWMKKATKGFFGLGADNREGIIMKDPSGNLKFEKLTTNMEGLVNGSSNGR